MDLYFKEIDETDYKELKEKKEKFIFIFCKYLFILFFIFLYIFLLMSDNVTTGIVLKQTIEIENKEYIPLSITVNIFSLFLIYAIYYLTHKKKESFTLKIIFSIIASIILFSVYILLFSKDIKSEIKSYILPSLLISSILIFVYNKVTKERDYFFDKNISQYDKDVHRLINKNPLFYPVYFVLLLPIVEELFLRLFFYNVIKINYGIIVGILGSGIATAITRAKSKKDMYFTYQYFFIGLIYTIIYAYTDNILLTISIHVILNAHIYIKDRFRFLNPIDKVNYVSEVNEKTIKLDEN